MADPHNCDAFADDTFTPEQGDAKRGRLVDLLSQAWNQREAQVICRYDDETVGNFVFNGWALWEKGNAHAPRPAPPPES